MRLKLSIRTKLVGMINAILLLAAAAIVVASTSLFSRDNLARIQEANLESARLLAQEVQNDVANLTEKMRLLGLTLIQPLPRSQTETLLKPFYESEREFLFETVLTMTSSGVRKLSESANDAALKALDLTREDVARLQQKLDATKLFVAREQVLSGELKGKIPVLTITIPLISDDGDGVSHVAIATIKQDRFLKAVSKEGVITSYLVDHEGNLLAHPDQDRVLKRENLSQLEIVKLLIAGKSSNGQTRFMDPETQVAYLGAFKTVGFGGIGVVSQVEESKALEAADKVRRISIIITAIVAIVAFAIMYLFSLSLTGPLLRLVEATAQIAQGRYDVHLKEGSSDEIGDLTHSFNEMASGLAEREKIKNAFSKFHSKDVADKILSGDLSLAGERKRVTVFFSDIRSFTTLSEQLLPEQVVELVNSYMTRMVRIIFAHGGVVDKYVGDAIMAVYGTPVSYGNDALRAVSAAIRMRAELKRFNEDQKAANKPTISIGMGMNTGDVVAGNIGSPERMEYTILGDNVNLTSRLESLTKELKTDILISAQTAREIQEFIDCVPRGTVKVKGKSEPVTVYEVVGFKEGREFIPSETKKTGETTNAAIRRIVGAPARLPGSPPARPGSLASKTPQPALEEPPSLPTATELPSLDSPPMAELSETIPKDDREEGRTYASAQSVRSVSHPAAEHKPPPADAAPAYAPPPPEPPKGPTESVDATSFCLALEPMPEDEKKAS